MSDTDHTRPLLRVEPLESRLTLSTAGTTDAPLPPPDVIVFGGDAAQAAPATGDQLAFGGDLISPQPLPPTGPIDTVVGGAGNDVI